MNQQTVYQTVSVQDELPTEAGRYGVLLEGFDCVDSEFFSRADTWITDHSHQVINWLKPTTGYFFTPEEFREVARIIWDESAVTTGKTIKPVYPDFQTFYNQLTGAGE